VKGYGLFSVSCLPIVFCFMSTYCVVQEKFEDINVVIEEGQTIQSGTRLVTLVTNTIYVCKYCVCLFVWTWHVFVFLCEHGICLSFCVNIVLVSFRKIVDIKDKLIHTLRNWECSSVLRTNVSDKRNDFNFPVVIFHLCVVTFQQHLYMGYIFLHEVFFRYS
jgi:hypothetical protein